jgi:hypothetical protein
MMSTAAMGDCGTWWIDDYLATLRGVAHLIMRPGMTMREHRGMMRLGQTIAPSTHANLEMLSIALYTRRRMKTRHGTPGSCKVTKDGLSDGLSA